MNNYRKLTEYFRRRSAVESRTQSELDLSFLPTEYNKDIFKSATDFIAEISETLSFYNAISDNLKTTHRQLKKFTSRIEEASRLDEEHLLPIALKVFDSAAFPVRTEYVPQQKNTQTVKVPLR